MPGLKLPKLDKTMPIVMFRLIDPKTGQMVEHVAIATPQMQRFWQQSTVKLDSAAGGGTFTAETAAASYDQPQMQRVIDALASLYRGLA